VLVVPALGADAEDPPNRRLRYVASILISLGCPFPVSDLVSCFVDWFRERGERFGVSHERLLHCLDGERSVDFRSL
jgi:hypothetical protein